VASALAAWHDHAMIALPPRPTLTPDARLERGRFVLAAIAVYSACFISHGLLTAPVTKLFSVVPFLVVQTVLIWLWVVLHRQRLRDAGRPSGIVIGIALLYAIEVILLALLIWVLTAPAEQSGDAAGIFHLYLLLYLIGSVSGESNLAGFQYWLTGLVGLRLLPAAISVIFSLWAATRPSVAVSAP
jgi:uncharacterized membrane protein YhaH (DUF805 family)